MTGRPGTACPVIRAGHDDSEDLSQLIADALHDDEVSRWLLPSPVIRRRIFPDYFALLVRRAMTGGLVYTTPGRTGVALWLPAGEHPSADPGAQSDQLAEITGPWAGQFRVFDTVLARHHPAGRAHHHLAILAVRPGQQGRGTGTALLAAHHTWLDQHGTPAYLEASSTRTRDLYQRHGYEPRPDSPISLPDGPRMWPMWREPRHVREP
ncbi:MAG TPA: GNAT family N-acetyltransferase [Streptosporangiaceae bacterium]|nr:GNAT family N-acetyltransferase [Streptosporangiaceae bacterium]